VLLPLKSCVAVIADTVSVGWYLSQKKKLLRSSRSGTESLHPVSPNSPEPQHGW